MNIRLHGTRDDCQRATEALAEVLDITRASAYYRDRPPSRLVRRYLTVTPPADGPQE